jgi:RimJ/RimL family protein N-acetyltransferase
VFYSIIWDRPDEVAAFVAPRIGEVEFSLFTAIGLERRGELIAGVVYTGLTDFNIQMHIAAIPGRRWCTREFIRAFFAYPFVQLRLPRVSALVKASNTDSLRFCEHIGMRREGLLREACETGDLVILGMLRRECRYLDEQPIRQERFKAAANA